MKHINNYSKLNPVAARGRPNKRKKSIISQCNSNNISKAYFGAAEGAADALAGPALVKY